jgi:hypothetical protein
MRASSAASGVRVASASIASHAITPGSALAPSITTIDRNAGSEARTASTFASCTVLSTTTIAQSACPMMYPLCSGELVA